MLWRLTCLLKPCGVTGSIYTVFPLTQSLSLVVSVTTHDFQLTSFWAGYNKTTYYFPFIENFEPALNITMVFQASIDFSDPDDTAKLLFWQSCQQGDLVQVKELLFYGTATAGSKCLGLWDAVVNSHVEVICFLLENNVIIDQQVVTAVCSPEAFELLFEHGLDVNQIMGLGLVPLM